MINRVQHAWAIWPCLLLFCWSFHPPVHDLPLGMIRIQLESHRLTMQLKFDRADLERAATADPAAIERYILSRSRLSVNDRSVPLAMVSLTADRDHYLIELHSGPVPQPATTLLIYNACLVQEVEDQSNIVRLHYGEQLRGFRLHAGRVETKVAL